MEDENNISEQNEVNISSGENSPPEVNSGSAHDQYNDEYDNYCPWE